MLKHAGTVLKSSSSSSRFTSSRLLSPSSSSSRSLSSLISSSSSFLKSKQVPPSTQTLQPSRFISSSSPKMSSVAVNVRDFVDNPPPPPPRSFIDQTQDLLETKKTKTEEPKQLTKEEKLEARAELLAAQIGVAFLLRAVIKVGGRVFPGFQTCPLEYSKLRELLNDDQKRALSDLCYYDEDDFDGISEYNWLFAPDYDPSKQVTCIDESRPDEIPTPEELFDFIKQHTYFDNKSYLTLAERLWKLNDELRDRHLHPAFNNPLEVLALCRPVPRTLKNRVVQTFSFWKRFVRAWKIANSDF